MALIGQKEKGDDVMKRLLVAISMILLVGCGSEVVNSPDYEISNISQSYSSYGSITGQITNTGNCTLYDIIVMAMSEDKVLMGTTEAHELRAGESTEFKITATIGSNHIARVEDIEYRVYYDVD